MDLEERIKSFALLGESLRKSININSGISVNGRDHSIMQSLIKTQVNRNPWFTPENVTRAITAIANELTEENLVKWTSTYNGINDAVNPLSLAVIMAGNIPLVGFHDFLSVLITGNNLIAKASSKDFELINYLSNVLCDIDRKS